MLSDPKTKRILVIDDDKVVCSFFRNFLALEGFQVAASLNGRQAVETLKSGSALPDLIVLDLMMPNYGGYEVLKELQQESFKNIPVLIVTARAVDREMIDMIRSESNVGDFFSKPIQSKAFKSRIHEILGTTPPENPVRPADFEWME